MDRRRNRFTPAAEGLEGRALLATMMNRNPFLNPLQAQQAGSRETIEQKNRRIDNLPFFLTQIQPGRKLPAEATATIQNNLRLLIGRLQKPASSSLVEYNKLMRSTLSRPSLPGSTVRAVSDQFGKILTDAGAGAEIVENLQDALLTFAKQDSEGRDPAIVAANDYSLVLQTALGVGKPVRVVRNTPHPRGPSRN